VISNSFCGSRLILFGWKKGKTALWIIKVADPRPMPSSPLNPLPNFKSCSLNCPIIIYKPVLGGLYRPMCVSLYFLICFPFCKCAVQTPDSAPRTLSVRNGPKAQQTRLLRSKLTLNVTQLTLSLRARSREAHGTSQRARGPFRPRAGPAAACQRITWYDKAARYFLCRLLLARQSASRRPHSAAAASSLPKCWPSSTGFWTGSGRSSGRRRWSSRWWDFSTPGKPHSSMWLRYVCETSQCGPPGGRYSLQGRLQMKCTLAALFAGA